MRRIKFKDDNINKNMFGATLLIKIGKLARSIREEIQKVRVIRGLERKSIEKIEEDRDIEEFRGYNFNKDSIEISINEKVVVYHRLLEGAKGSKSKEKDIKVRLNIFLK